MEEKYKQLFELLKNIDKINRIYKRHIQYKINLLRLLNANEVNISLIFSKILSYNNKEGKKIVLENFINTFIKSAINVDINFDNAKIVEEENDIDILIKTDTIAIIIENKIKGANFQRNQLARYIKKTIEMGYKPEHIFIVIIPNYCSKSYLGDIRKSVWKLPPDWNIPNQERACVIHNNLYECLCDRDETHKNCSHCKDYFNDYKNRTIILDKKFSKWLDNLIGIVSENDVLLKSALVQLSDFVKEYYIMEERKMEINKLLDEYLSLENNTKEEKVARLEEICNQIQSIKDVYESEIKYENKLRLMKKWIAEIKDKQKNENIYNEIIFRPCNTAFYFEVGSLQIGCWSGIETNNETFGVRPWDEYADKPYCGVLSTKETLNQEEEDFINYIEKNISIKPTKNNRWPLWYNTENGVDGIIYLYNIYKKYKNEAI